ncbi:MAG: N-acetyltransferase [Acinetobacter sp.]|nr:MAG: N-acetyltransferase [Acinetobacter sp.]
MTFIEAGFMQDFNIKKLHKQDEIQVRDFVLGIQNGEFGLGFLPEEQPDLMNTSEYYRSGGFWIAKIRNQICGTIGLQKIDSQNGVLRKMFVEKAFRGPRMGIAQNLFDKLKSSALEKNLKFIFLDTPAIAQASHKFYLRNGFQEIGRDYPLPTEYKYPDRDSKIFLLEL